MSHNIITVNNSEPDVEGNITGVAPNQIIMIGEGASVDYSLSPATSTISGATLFTYDSSPINTIGSATINQTNGWVTSVVLPAGRYHIQAGFQVEFSASGSLMFAVAVNGTALASYGRVGAQVTSHFSAGGLACLTLYLTSTATLTLKSVVSSNVAGVASQGTTPSEHGWILIRKEVS